MCNLPKPQIQKPPEDIEDDVFTKNRMKLLPMVDSPLGMECDALCLSVLWYCLLQQGNAQQGYLAVWTFTGTHCTEFRMVVQTVKDEMFGKLVQLFQVRGPSTICLKSPCWNL